MIYIMFRAEGNPSDEEQESHGTSTGSDPKGGDDRAQLFTFILAFVVIVAFLFFYFLVIYYNPAKTDVKLVSSTLGNIVASIIGYYFGQRPVQQAAKAARAAETDRDRFKDKLADTYDTVQKAIQAKTLIDQLNQRLLQNERLLKDANDQIERLKNP
jgi:hypothetical protein